MNKIPGTRKNNKHKLFEMIIWGIAAIALWVIVPITVSLSYKYFKPDAQFPDSFATLGDTFGSASSLFSALAMAGVIYSLRLQQIDQRLTRQEMAKARIQTTKAAKAQLEISTTEKENLEEKRRITAGHLETNTRLLQLLDRQSEALSNQIDKVSQQLRIQSQTYFREIFDKRFENLERTRTSWQKDGKDLREYLEASVVESADRKELTFIVAGQAIPRSSSLPYEILGRDYVRCLRSILSLTKHPTFKDVDPDEREWFGTQVAELLFEKEKLVLLCAFHQKNSEKTPKIDEPTEKQPRRSLRDDLAAMNALAFIHEKAKKYFKNEWSDYREMMKSSGSNNASS